MFRRGALSFPRGIRYPLSVDTFGDARYFNVAAEGRGATFECYLVHCTLAVLAPLVAFALSCGGIQAQYRQSHLF